MRLKNCLFYVILILGTPTWAQLRDTILYSMSSRPFYYNVLKGGDGRIYAGTSEGVFTLEGAVMKKLNNQIGYLTLNKKGSPAIDHNGIRYHDQSTYARMLPYPTEIRDEYHAGTEEFFYITSAGRMYIFEILPYELRYRNHSVRTTSHNFIGTYSGLYFRGRKLESPSSGFPPFTDGYIRELNGKVFICYSSLVIAEIRQGDSLPSYWKNLPRGFTFLATDVLFSSYHKKYLVSAKTDLVLMDSALTYASSLYRSNNKDAEVVVLGENRGSVYFASGRDFIQINPTSKKFKTVISLPEPILSGHITNLNHYLLGSQGLYVVRADGNMKKLIDLAKAHTLLHLGGSEFAISTDAGLFQYNEVSNKLTKLIQGVEFNRRGLYLEGDSLFAGSINGLYVLDAKHLDQLADRVAKSSGEQSLPVYFLSLLIGIALIAITFIYLHYRSRSQLKQIIAETQMASLPKLTREDIETFIKENLAQASLKSIAEKFKTNNAVIYTLLSPEKPGAFINRLRMEQVKRLRKEGKPAREISQLTGFSEYYVRKVWNVNQ